MPYATTIQERQRFALMAMHKRRAAVRAAKRRLMRMFATLFPTQAAKPPRLG